MKNKKKLYSIITFAVCCCIALIIAIFVIKNNSNKENMVMDVYNQYFDGKGLQYMSDEVKDSSAIQKVSANGYDVSMVSSLYDKYTGIGYFIFKIDGDMKRMKEQEDDMVLDTVLHDPSMYFGVSDYAGKVTGRGIGYVKGSKYIRLWCVMDESEDKDIHIELLGDDEKVYGKYDINRSRIDYTVKKIEENSELEGYISPLGAKFTGNYNALDKIILVYNDRSEKEITYTQHACNDNGIHSYLFKFSQIENVDDINEVIMVNVKGDRDMKLKLVH